MIVEDFCRVHPAKCHVCHSATASPVVDTGGTVHQGTSRYRVYICANCVLAMAKALEATGKVNFAVVSDEQLESLLSNASVGAHASHELAELKATLSKISELVDL